jgi:hypothetical protein
MNVYLKGGPCDGETVNNVKDTSGIVTRFAKDPEARYKNTGTDDGQGRRIFEHFPPKPGEPTPTEGVHDA